MILREIADRTRERISREKVRKPLEVLKSEVEQLPINEDFPFEAALKTEDIAFICEVKKASPSKGIIAEEFDPVAIAKDYAKAGANAISVLTEPYYFKGSNEHIREIKKHVALPLLRKDFTIDEYMIYEAKEIGADAVLLICSLLDNKQLQSYLNLAHSLGLSCLVEAHDEEEVKRAISAGARIIGVNNRDLKDFSVDISNSLRLRRLLPNNIIFISESGIKTPEDIENLRKNKTNGVLIGETLMKSDNKVHMLRTLRGR
ncbi:MAG: indole-3-glycerol phosphate synthase TrpC [Clostridiales bacterium]|nr:indole-3-glycerol phosphate synthase TrpC [Clostridiales bacterium]